jgi:anaerobic dimethyl sulfoxide reductase subunit A
MSSRDSSEKVVLTSCSYDCGARCLLKVRVKEGRIVHIGTDERPMPSLKACIRGLAQKDVVYAPDRLTKPLKRVGQRGEGKFEPISWEEALETVSNQLQRVKKNFGNSAILLVDYSGSISPLQGMGKPARRFFSLFGGCTTWWGITSYEAALFSSLVTFGTAFTGSTKENFLHSRLIILWGFDPVVSRFGPDMVHYLGEAKKAGARIICVDPRLSRTARALAHQWIAVRPGTDAAMLIAMAHVLIKEDLCDHRFIETHTHGFETFEAYVLGREDGVAKTPQWAQEITGVSAEVIHALARDYGTVKPAALVAGWAPGRSAYGEQYHRAASVLSAMSGNIGITGGYAGGGLGRVPMGYLKKVFPAPGDLGSKIHIGDIYKAMLEGKSGGYPSDVKLLYLVGCNLLNQFLNLNKGVDALKEPEFIVIHERFMTPTARFADLVLPVTTSMEREDIGLPWSGSPYFIFLNKAIEPLGETKSDLEIFSELARRLNLQGYNDRSDEEWLRSFVEATPDLPAFEAFKAKGFHEIGLAQPWVAFRDQVDKGGPFPTPSGRIEIFSEKIAEMNNPLLPPIPKYIEPWEGPKDPLRARYPLQLVSPHARTRVNSQFDNIPSLKALADDTAWLSREDAEARGIVDGENVMIYNDRGRMIARAKVTDRIIPGVVSFDEGAWYRPDARGVDLGGCVNVLTKDEKSPAGAFPCNTCLVEVKKVD